MNQETKEAETVRIDLNRSFTARDLEEIIAKFAHARSTMQPRVSMEPPSGLDEVVLEQEIPLFIIRTLTNGGLRIWLRNEGLGWLAFALMPADRVRLREFLGKEAGHSFTKH